MKTTTFELFGYLINIAFATTIWVHNQEMGELGSREDFFFKLSRWYARDQKSYIYTLVIHRFSIRWAKI